MDTQAAAELLQLMEVPSHRGTFVLGVHDRRVTLLSQQTRALNLVAALAAADRVKAGSRVAVVGAGIGGVTAAVALAGRGVSVTLLERAQDVFSIQRQSTRRWLHPHIFDWPLPQQHRAGLPLLDWNAGYARDVMRSLERELAQLRHAYSDRLQLRFGCREVQLFSKGSKT